jgi:hypothetical protein
MSAHKRADLHLEPETVLDLYGAIRNVLGADLTEIAGQSPHTAYDLIRNAMLTLTAATDPNSLPDIEALLPSPITETTDVTIHALAMPDGPGAEHRTLDRESSVILSFTVESLTEPR